MRRFLLLLLVVVLLTPVAVLVALNTGAGRGFAEREINRLAGPDVSIAGLGGHFPADIKLASVSLADAQGVWLSGSGLELRWQPLALLGGGLHVVSLSAQSLSVMRLPAANAGSRKKGSFGLPNVRLALDQLKIGTLSLAPALAGEPVVLQLQGAAYWQGGLQGNVVLNAAAPDGTAQYHLAASLNHANSTLLLHIAEPAGGLLAHFAGPGPLLLDASLAGPRNDAALQFHAVAAPGELQGAGTLGLKGRRLDVALTAQAMPRTLPKQLQALLGGQDDVTLQAQVSPAGVKIAQLALNHPGFAVQLQGDAGHGQFSLAGQAQLADAKRAAPGLSGGLTATVTAGGKNDDFAVQAMLAGDVAAQGRLPTAPFSLSLEAKNLPHTPHGTLNGSGMLEGAPLALAADFAWDAGAGGQLRIAQAKWRSLEASADLRLAPGAILPSGTAQFAVTRLADIAPFLPFNVQGAASGDFADTGGENFKLNVQAQNLLLAPELGLINAKLQAAGPEAALAVQGQGRMASLQGAPAAVNFAGVVNLHDRSARVTRLSGSWRGLNPLLQGPVSITSSPLAVRGLKLALAGGGVTLDGMFQPRLQAQAQVQNMPASLAHLFDPALAVQGKISASAQLSGTLAAPSGTISLQGRGLHLQNGAAALLPPGDFSATANLAGTSAQLDAKLAAGKQLNLALRGQAPLRMQAPMALHLTGIMDLNLLNPLLAAQDSAVSGLMNIDLQLSGTPAAPSATGRVNLQDGSVQNISSGFSLTKIQANMQAAGPQLVLQNFSAQAGQGSLSGSGTLALDGEMPVTINLTAEKASPVSSDLITETLDADLRLQGALRGAMLLGGTVNIRKADINIPHGLPPSVANLPIIQAGHAPPPPPAPPPAVALAVDVRAQNQIFVRGDGLFAELGGHIKLAGTTAAPDPQGGFTLLRGNMSLAGKTLQFTQGKISFTGAGFMPTLDLQATVTAANNSSNTLTVGGTAAKPTFTLTSTPPQPSDEILAQLLFGQSASSLSPFQAASLAAALAQIAGFGSGLNPLDKVRGALGLDELSVGGSGSGPPSLQAGRYVVPGVYVGASQATNGQGTQVNVQVNLFRGLKLQTQTGTGTGTTGNASSVGLSYQFNY